ncbi:IS110 family transposase [Listeria welshimeri]|nr:IS110 family transposase [Listeria welshimeri]
MIQKAKHIYIGIDIHKETHTAVILTYLEEKLGEVTFSNTLQGFQKLYRYIQKQKQQYTPIFGLEDVTHYGRNLAIYLLEQGEIVKEVNSALSHMERMSYPSTKKNDTWDAQCISAVLMRRVDILPNANPVDYYWTMKQLVNRRNALIKATTALVRQFHDQLKNHYASYKKFFHEIDCQTSLAFFERYPSPSHLEGMTDEELGEFLRVPSNNSCSTKRANKILTLVSEDSMTEREYQFARDFTVQSIARHIRFNVEETKRIEKVQKAMLQELGYHLETIPGVDIVTASALVAHIGEIERFPNANKLAMFAGIAPVRYSSAGKGKYVQNKQGNRELYSVLYFLAIQQVHINNKGNVRNPVLRAYFERKISEGKTKIQALICIMRRLVTIIYYSMMKHKTVYKIPSLEEKEIS